MTAFRDAIARAQTARLRLRQRAVDDIVASIDQVIANWLRADYSLRQRAVRELPAVTGFSPEMIAHGLPLLLAALRGDALRALLDDELGDRRILDHGSGRRALGPRLVLHVLSGNIAGLAAMPMALSLTLKSAVLVKPAGGDPLFAELFAASIREVDAGLADCIVVAHWRGGDTVFETVAFAAADLVVASGSDAAIATIRARVPGRFIGHGHRISFALIGRERLDSAATAGTLAQRLAYDVSLWDQQGCLSPQLCYVESGGRVAPGEFAALVAEALSTHAHTLPPRQLSFEEKAQVLRFRQDAEWRGPDGPTLLASAGSSDWSVSLETDAEFRPTCLNRCVRLKVVADLAEIGMALSPHRRYVEAAGVAVAAHRLPELVTTLAESGVHRICPLGTMQLPPLTWRQSGRPRVGDWVDWISDEHGA